MRNITVKASASILGIILVLPLYAKVPTGEDVRKFILPALIMREIADLRMAEFDLSKDLQILDFTAVDQTAWGEPNCSEVSFRLYFKAMQDVYSQKCEDGDGENTFTLHRVALAGKQYAISFKITVKSETEPDANGQMQTVFKLAKQPDRGDWAFENGLTEIGPIGSRRAWESVAEATGSTLRFYNSGRERETAALSPAPHEKVAFPDPLVQYCPEQVRVEVRSRSLGEEPSIAGNAAEYSFPIAHHDHVFVFDAKTKALVDDIGWSDKNGGSAFRDYGNYNRYGEPFRYLELPGNIYFDIRNTFAALGKHFGYRLINDAEWTSLIADAVIPVTKVLSPLHIASTMLKCAKDSSEEEIAGFLVCNLYAIIGEGQSASERLSRSESYNRPGFDSKNLKLMVNCQLWARYYLDALEKAKQMFEHPHSAAANATQDSAKQENPQQSPSRRTPARPTVSPCFPCFMHDLTGTCSDSKCPNYGRPHSEYKRQEDHGMPHF